MNYLSMIMGGVQGTAGIVTGIVGAYQARKAKKEQERLHREQQERVDAQRREDEAWYNKERYTSTLDREENKAAISAANEAINEQNKRAESKAAITGASAESMAAQRANNMKLMGQLSRDIAASGTRYKQWVDQQNSINKGNTNAMQQGLDNAQNSMYQGRVNNASQLVNNGVNMFSDSFSTFMGGSGGK